MVRREVFSRARKAWEASTARLEVMSLDQDGERVGVRLTGGLTEDPISSAGIGQDDGGPHSGSGEVGKWERNQDYGSCCRWAHAQSSSGRFQSSASAGSLSSAVSMQPRGG